MSVRVIIDTQALIWFAENAPALSTSAIALVDDPATVRLASVASIWEMAIKISIGKLILNTGTLSAFVEMLRANEIDVLPVLAEDALRVGELPIEQHKDPFDRLIAAQCLRQNFTLISIDKAFDHYGVNRVW
jgi:PIN domain nuclease of toxin-antitoxin system